ncbi:MAG TPA: hypothetical protein PK830_09575 [Candidatus Atribacteria bacterium]|nr:hypothetical protein [Candidatus Atribacteria bacterium]
MVSEKGAGCLIKQASGTLWYFFLDDQRLFYTKKLDAGWASPVSLDMHVIKYYSAILLNDDRIMILAYLSSKELWLYELAGGKWHKRSLYKISTGFENITFLKLVLSQGRLHMFYYIESSLPTAKDKLMHYMLDGDTWKRLEPLHFVSGASFSPLDIRSGDPAGLHLFVKRELHGTTAFFMSIFDESTMGWSEKHLLFERPGKCRSFSCLPDRTGYIHFVWNEESLRKQILYYKKIEKNDLDGRITEDVPIYYSTKEIRNPALVPASKPVCFWMEGTKALYCVLQRNSSGVYEVKSVDREKVCPYTYIIYDGYKNEPNIIYGDGYPGFDWNVLSLPDMNQGIENPDLAKTEDEGEAAISEPVSSSAQEQHEEKKLAELESKLDDLYSALFQIKEYIRQKDMSLYQLSTQVKKLTFDIEQMRSKNIQYKSRTLRRSRPVTVIHSPGTTEAHVSINDTEDKSTDGTEIQEGQEEIVLGSVSIIVNPEDEAEDDKE